MTVIGNLSWIVDKNYSSKLLLFGEYTVLNGSQALAVPLNKWHGHWMKHANQGVFIVPEYYAWLFHNDLVDSGLLQSMEKDVESGWQYYSNIPIGYGVGSSGAYVAALYDRYFLNKNLDLKESTSIVAKMESYFHGSSSGMDPLVSLYGQAVYKNAQGDFQLMDDPGWPPSYSVYLLDSGASRETAPLVTHYKDQLKKKEYADRIEKQLVPMVEHALHFYLQGECMMLEECISLISQMQREYFEGMIPAQVRLQWDELSSQDGIYMKLCGAGGGGYYLIIKTKPELKFVEHFEDSLLKIV